MDQRYSKWIRDTQNGSEILKMDQRYSKWIRDSNNGSEILKRIGDSQSCIMTFEQSTSNKG
jgi:hypothetical protein